MDAVTPADVEAWVARMRQEVAVEPPAPGDVRTADQVMHQLELVDSVAAKALWVVKEADRVRADAAENLLRARAKAQGTVEGKTAADRAAAVDLSVEAERAAEAAAQVAYRYAKGMADLLDSRKSSLQTQAKLVLAEMQLAGAQTRRF